MVAVDVFDVIAIQRPEVVARRGHCGSPSVGPQAAWPSIGSSAETVRCLIPTIDARAIDSPMTRTAPVSIKQEDFIQYVRSDERRVGKEWYRQCRYRWSPYH